MSDERKVILEKRKEIAEPKTIGGSELSKENGVNVQKDVLNFCVCGDMIDENKIMICQEGKEKLCEGCAILHDRKYFCIDCFQEKYPLTKQQYKVLMCLSNEVAGRGMMHNLTRIPKKELKEVLQQVRESGYVERKWLRYRITDKGMDAYSAYSSVWRSDKDIFVLKREIIIFLGI